jgi:hypothetical protein
MAHYTSELEPFKHLKFVTIAPKRGAVTPRESKAFVQTLWNDLYRRFHYRCEKHSVPFAYLKAFEMDDDGYWHVHVILNLPVPVDEMPSIWSSGMEGTTSEVKTVDSEKEIADTVAYLIKHRFENRWHERHRGGRNTKLSASNGLGYNSAAAKAKRRAFVAQHSDTSEPETVENEAEWWDYIIERIERAVGEDVIVDGAVSRGEPATGMLVGTRGDRAIVFRNGHLETYLLLDVYPVGETSPKIRLKMYMPWEDEDIPKRRVLREEISDDRMEAVRSACPVTDVIVPQSDGSRVRHRQNSETGTRSTKVLTTPIEQSKRYGDNSTNGPNA